MKKLFVLAGFVCVLAVFAQAKNKATEPCHAIQTLVQQSGLTISENVYNLCAKAGVTMPKTAMHPKSGSTSNNGGGQSNNYAWSNDDTQVSHYTDYQRAMDDYRNWYYSHGAWHCKEGDTTGGSCVWSHGDLNSQEAQELIQKMKETYSTWSRYIEDNYYDGTDEGKQMLGDYFKSEHYETNLPAPTWSSGGVAGSYTAGQSGSGGNEPVQEAAAAAAP
ncbi:MAG: hypothetical protein J6V32_06595 [Elusimicrobiaceae bacterium]|nr:hypothetical protein [Elusimicrobiaceae bacterium]